MGTNSMIVSVALCNLLIDGNDFETRLNLFLVVLLTSVAFSFVANDQIPHVPYETVMVGARAVAVAHGRVSPRWTSNPASLVRPIATWVPHPMRRRCARVREQRLTVAPAA